MSAYLLSGSRGGGECRDGEGGRAKRRCGVFRFFFVHGGVVCLSACIEPWWRAFKMVAYLMNL